MSCPKELNSEVMPHPKESSMRKVKLLGIMIDDIITRNNHIDYIYLWKSITQNLFLQTNWQIPLYCVIWVTFVAIFGVISISCYLRHRMAKEKIGYYGQFWFKLT